MAKDFSWKTAAAEYAKLYEEARAARGLQPARNQMPVATSN
jgi:glycogen synthase